MIRQRANRRDFLRSVALGSAIVPWIHLPTRADQPAANRITLGFIGVGTMGRGHLRGFLGNPGVRVVAVNDVVAERLNSAKQITDEHYSKQTKKENKDCVAYKDFRDILARKDIDAVVIATPDHWHAIPCILAARAGKHIYCEKPLTHSIVEGRRIVEAVRKAGVIFQTGSQQRSEFANRFRTAVELVRNGRIGKVKTIHIGVGGPPIPCDLPEQPLPEGTDFDFWLGPAPQRGFHEVLCPKGIHSHFPQWRKYREYGGGGLADMGAHHFDIAQWALDMDHSGPVKIEPPSGKADKGLKFTYANGVEMFHGGSVDCLFEGTEGVIRASRGKLEVEPEKLLSDPLPANAYRVYPSNDHKKNWLECIRAKKPAICPAEVGHRTATICHLANIGYQLRRPLQWDPVKEQFVGDAEANKFLARTYREPWSL